MAFELELPAVYLDVVLLDPTPSRPTVINRDPEPGETQVPVATDVALDLTDVGPDGIDTAATKIYLGGQLAFDGGSFEAGFDGPGSAATTPQADTLRVVIDPVAPSPASGGRSGSSPATTGGAHTLDQS
jgi:hypothetical protein